MRDGTIYLRKNNYHVKEDPKSWALQQPPIWNHTKTDFGQQRISIFGLQMF